MRKRYFMAPVVLTTLLLCTGASAADKAGALAPKGVGRDACKELTKVYDERSQELFLVASWLDGYVTSVNTYSNGVYDVALPAAVAVKEGINVPRYPTITGRMRARKATLRTFPGQRARSGLATVALRTPP